jgi:hypothetical protein
VREKVNYPAQRGRGGTSTYVCRVIHRNEQLSLHSTVHRMIIRVMMVKYLLLTMLVSISMQVERGRGKGGRRHHQHDDDSNRCPRNVVTSLIANSLKKLSILV